jgi:hypothetical protein
MIAIRDGNNPNKISGFNLPLLISGIIPAIVHVNIQLFIKHIVCNIYHTVDVILEFLFSALILNIIIFIIFNQIYHSNPNTDATVGRIEVNNIHKASIK